MISGIVTAILLVAFVVGVFWAYSPKRRQAFDAAAQLPLDEPVPVRIRRENTP